MNKKILSTFFAATILLSFSHQPLSAMEVDIDKKQVFFGTAEKQTKGEDGYSNIPKDDNGDAFFGVFDGHGGNEENNWAGETVVNHLKNTLHKNIVGDTHYPDNIEQAITNGFLKTNDLTTINDNELKKAMQYAGSTATVVLVPKDGPFWWLAYAGDSSAFGIKKDGSMVPLSNDHKPSDLKEKKRIEESGGTITHGGNYVNGRLNTLMVV